VLFVLIAALTIVMLSVVITIVVAPLFVEESKRSFQRKTIIPFEILKPFG